MVFSARVLDETGTPACASEVAALDNLGRRTSVVRTGTAFSGGSGNHFDLWGYNDRSELTSGQRYAGTSINDTSNPVSAMDRLYDYDHIGNRESQTPGTQSPITYVADSKNQYESLVDPASPDFDPQQPALPTELFQHDADGNPPQYEVQIGSDARLCVKLGRGESADEGGAAHRAVGSGDGDRGPEGRVQVRLHEPQGAEAVYERDETLDEGAGDWESTPVDFDCSVERGLVAGRVCGCGTN